jgi:outer membrane protein OmpA-like peptidoglycan-associated protein
MVFFGSGSTELTNTAEITRFVSDYEKMPRRLVKVVGHADTAEENLALSLARAEVVKERLVARGIPIDRIEVVGRGDKANLVITPPGVSEPQNRRVDITVV